VVCYGLDFRERITTCRYSGAPEGPAAALRMKCECILRSTARLDWACVIDVDFRRRDSSRLAKINSIAEPSLRAHKKRYLIGPAVDLSIAITN